MGRRVERRESEGAREAENSPVSLSAMSTLKRAGLMVRR